MVSWISRPRWLRWRNGPDYEHELPRLSAQIKDLRARVLAANSRQRRWPFLFLLQAAVIYLIYVATSIRMSMHLHSRHVVATALTPCIIYIVYRIIYRTVSWQKARLDKQLNELTSKRKTLVEEYKKKTNFYEIQKLIQEDSQDIPQQQASGKAAAAQQSKSTNNQTAQNRLKNVPLKNSNLVASKNSVNNGAPKILAHGDAAADQHNQVTDPVPIYHTSWVDRVLDLIIGENEQSPSSRYALICCKCRAHNGLAPYGKPAEEVVYKCPVCGHHNGPDEAQLGQAGEEASRETSREASAEPKKGSAEPVKEASLELNADKTGSIKPIALSSPDSSTRQKAGERSAPLEAPHKVPSKECSPVPNLLQDPIVPTKDKLGSE